MSWSWKGLMASPKHLIRGQHEGYKYTETGTAGCEIIKEGERGKKPIIMRNVGLQRLRGTPVPQTQYSIVADTAEKELRRQCKAQGTNRGSEDFLLYLLKLKGLLMLQATRRV